MFIDHAVIFVRSGKGGDGCVSFRREKYVPKGGPDGGNGGRGGDVVLTVDPALTTLLPLTPRPHYRAEAGGAGGGRQMTGADGADCIVAVPPGTTVFDAETGERLADLTRQGEQWIAAPGGRGGFGNEHFKSATNQTPRDATPGEPAMERKLRLELRLIADVGLIGLPNAGKSTLLRALSRATPKVADYPFTTLHPHLGIATMPAGPGQERRLVFADNPGLIEGAAEGAGLGHEFLRHIERTRVLVHVVDAASDDPVRAYEVVRRELEAYALPLAERPEIVALNKIDLLPPESRDARLAAVTAALRLPPETAVVAISGAARDGLRELLEVCWARAGREEAAGWSARAAATE